jgi:hypothetical protein
MNLKMPSCWIFVAPPSPAVAFGRRVDSNVKKWPRTSGAT